MDHNYVNTAIKTELITIIHYICKIQTIFTVYTIEPLLPFEELLISLAVLLKGVKRVNGLLSTNGQVAVLVNCLAVCTVEGRLCSALVQTLQLN